MDVIRCKNGHFFDGDSYDTCPHCGEAAITVGDSSAVKDEKKSIFGRGRKEKNSDSKFAAKKTPDHVEDNTGSTEHSNKDNDNRIVEDISASTIKKKSSSFFARSQEKEKKQTEDNSVTPVTNDRTLDFWNSDDQNDKKAQNAESQPLKKNTTLDFWQTSSHSKKIESEAEIKNKDCEVSEYEGSSNAVDTSAVNDRDNDREKNSPSEVPSLREAVKIASASNEGKTMSYFSAATSQINGQSSPKRVADPVVGWLVCISGNNFGDAFNIYAGKNSIGRSSENRVVIADDNSISRIKHALIVYEPKKRNFYLQPGDSSGLTYLNDEYITESHKLSVHDMIELGDSKFMFIPLCGEAFSWEEYMPKGE